MCGIVGLFDRAGRQAPTTPELDRMVAMVRHRGPEAAGFYIDDEVALGHARLSIVDLEGGLQPLTNEDESVWLVCNGEVFNFVEVRSELQARGHRFKTGSDCETILHLYEEQGPDCVHALNGDFAFALWDRRRQRLVLARDRVGVRPLFYAEAGGRLMFASEIKALLTQSALPRELDIVALGQVFTAWAPMPPRTMFRNVHALRPGHVLVADRDGVAVRQYWRPEFPAQDAAPPMSDDDAAEQLRALLEDATRLRMRADVPVGSYVSGGLDSSAITGLARRYTNTRLHTFAVAFSDAEFDERPYQELIAQTFGTEHHTVECGPDEIGRVFPDVVWHAETPLLRTAPAPLYILAELVRQHGIKVVLTGEGADEALVGYDIFKEAKVRAFWRRDPDSKLRPLLFRALYGHIPHMASPSDAIRAAFFGAGLDEADERAFSHQVRWRNTQRLHRMFDTEVKEAVDAAGLAEISALLDGQQAHWDQVSRAQYNEMTTFLDPYLLSSQGDRVAMAHAVEGRFPYLDYRVLEFCQSLPSSMKMRGLKEKMLLKRAMSHLVPDDILNRPKQPFRAPIRSVFSGPNAPEYVRDLLSPSEIARWGIFKPQAAQWLLNRSRSGEQFSETDNMALVGMVSLGLFLRAFWDEWGTRTAKRCDDLVTVADYRTVQIDRAFTRAS